MSHRTKRQRANDEHTNAIAAAEAAALGTIASAMLLGAALPARAADEEAERNAPQPQAAAERVERPEPRPAESGAVYSDAVASRSETTGTRDLPPVAAEHAAALPQAVTKEGGARGDAPAEAAAPPPAASASLAPASAQPADSIPELSADFGSSFPVRMEDFFSRMASETKLLVAEVTGAIGDVSTALFGTTGRLASIGSGSEPAVPEMLEAGFASIRDSAAIRFEAFEQDALFSKALQPAGFVTGALGSPSESAMTASVMEQPLAVSAIGEGTIPTVPEIAPMQAIGFLGQSYADQADPHDLSFSQIGSTLHGLG
jgi:hypothetical protein